ncbi:MAG: C69 family dipeptidase [Bacteroidales bacterium]|jgi:dipeptidase|nr:C69 family dipeptidase [Bacteroidales bacterium]MDD2570071.1 C69 family dipeptidase [Bacteroidales bacterium]MDD2812814.1 C69 family dipeptidase [Bacteroidales bacterium]MDD3384858.1 C69 family dipeptidase [Bacteroidales bacterium]MDD3871364.1 C69 family dipeptidase [Bacteroidales bacterium]
MNKFLNLLVIALLWTIALNAQEFSKADWVGEVPDGCTSITVGKMATIDGSVITSHTDDSHRTSSAIDIVPPMTHTKGTFTTMYRRVNDDSKAMPTYAYPKTGEIPQVTNTYGYINSAYPCMNEYQLGVGESTFGGRPELRSDVGFIDCQDLIRLMMERCKTVREALDLTEFILEEYGWIDAGECLTIADKHEVWHLEIVGPGKGKKGAVWVAQRVPDDHLSVNANASTIKEIDLNNPEYFRASDNIYRVAREHGWWNEGETFRFCYAYAPESRTSIAARRREWRVFDLVAPSLKLDPNAENYPFSVKPDQPVTLDHLITIFKDYYEGTDFNFVKDITVTDEDGKTIISPMANPFMPYDMNKVFKINGGWGWLGERTIARWYTMYATIIQCRDWLPDEVGGVTWMALDNVATSVYIPIFAGVTDLPQTYKVDGRVTGYSTESAWWAFNRLSTLAAQRWGDMRKDVDAEFLPLQKEIFERTREIEEAAVLVPSIKERKQLLTQFTVNWGTEVVKRAWKLGDLLWTRYDEKF